MVRKIEIIVPRHEGVNGFCYPKKLENLGIGLEANVPAEAEVVEIMLPRSPYRPTKRFSEAICEREPLQMEAVISS